MNFGSLSGLSSNVQFATPLGATAWAVLAGIPVGIVALYFLKLRRRPVQVPSTLLWKRSIEDLHVNSLFQRLRRNLLLFLQLAAVLLAMLALTGPRIKGTSAQGQRYVLTIDNSASMSATDVKPSRLAIAKIDAKKVVASMDSDDLAMVIAFSDGAKVISSYTGDRRLLAQRIDSIQPTESATSLREALQVAAGLANPSRQKDVGEGVVATQLVAPKLKIYTDGGFSDVEGFSLGNLEPEVIVIGPPPPPVSAAADPKPSSPARTKTASDNVAILALQSRRNDERIDTYQVFGRIHNYRGQPVETEAQLLRHDPKKPGEKGNLIDAIALKLAPQSDQSFKFELPDTGMAELEVRLLVEDSLALDNRAFTVVGNPRKAQVLVVTAGNRYLVDTLRTPTAVERADVTVVAPEETKSDAIARDLRSGRYDLVIYDHFRPETSPEANALYFGVLPPGPAYAKSKIQEQPIILDWDVSHPLMQYVRDLPTVAILKAVTVEPPPGSTNLIEGNQGPLAFVAPREGYSDAVVTFALMDGEKFNTNWYRNISFPLFLFNSLQVLGNARESAGDDIHLPGRPVVLRAESSKGQIKVTSADGKKVETLSRTLQGTYVDDQVDATGIYHARWEPDGLLAFAVNQFDARESDLATRGLVPEGIPPDSTLAESYKIKIGYNPVSGTRNPRPIRKDWWKPIAAIALGIVLLEWYIYNRRVYV
ncbi:BatA and WFA domain-containing protein [Singulisphaera sp. Ch08]|uniref:BatA and WFA domain-containing protein n=1 Tax=Singulisphaera sp. Ch08 TaxID=3120278 RepID=A0AAU7CCS1_9BACT